MIFAYTSIVFASIFILILLLLHFLNRELDPSWRMISEYEIGRFGWMMRVAFFCWGGSLLTLLISLWPYLQPVAGTISRWWFVLIVLALFGAGIFKTNLITDRTPSLVNTLHTLCGAIVILTFPVAATLAVTGLLNDQFGPAQGNLLLFWSTHRGWVTFATVLTWMGMVAYFATVIASRIKNPQAGEPEGPIVYQGWPNRFMVLTYIVWIIILAATVLLV